ncbi:MAG: S-methyl-5'-thioinosine phosphorylase [Gammaproteobacteria bacterium]|nr:S-methyl-5'-thioinosine phosphorylase [Gammaproteobacteria bacterium]
MTVAVIGGSGFHRWEQFVHEETLGVMTPYASAAVPVLAGKLGSHEIVFVPRHGPDHTLPPHRVNYRANIRALHELGVNAVLAIATVGGISPGATPGVLMIPDQILDYTYGRAHTFFDGEDGAVGHADMSQPYTEALRGRLIETAQKLDIAVIEQGTYAATQGPRFETPAEIKRLEQDGADVVGMTGMPEAALARELRLAYAAIAVVVNPAAGKVDGGISVRAVQASLSSGRVRVGELLGGVIPAIHHEEFAVPPPITP